MRFFTVQQACKRLYYNVCAMFRFLLLKSCSAMTCKQGLSYLVCILNNGHKIQNNKIIKKYNSIWKRSAPDFTAINLQTSVLFLLKRKQQFSQCLYPQQRIYQARFLYNSPQTNSFQISYMQSSTKRKKETGAKCKFPSALAHKKLGQHKQTG